MHLILDWSGESKNECTHQGNSHAEVPWRKLEGCWPESFLHRKPRASDQRGLSARAEVVLVKGVFAKKQSALGGESDFTFNTDPCLPLPFAMGCSSCSVTAWLILNVSKPPGPAGLIHIWFLWNSKAERESSLLLCCSYKNCPPASSHIAVSKSALTQIPLISPQVSRCCGEKDIKELIVWCWEQLEGVEG